MPHYSELSGQARDVMIALVDLADGPIETVNAVDIRNRTAEIREEAPTDYTYEILSNLRDDGWVVKTKDANDNRAVLYSLSREGWEEINNRIDLFTQTSSLESKATEGRNRRVKQSN
jgi:DNA-binding PadR family transcriptional regulator